VSSHLDRSLQKQVDAIDPPISVAAGSFVNAIARIAGRELKMREATTADRASLR
jgi:hypothetical protein